jgi:hypothetical protein
MSSFQDRFIRLLNWKHTLNKLITSISVIMDEPKFFWRNSRFQLCHDHYKM